MLVWSGIGFFVAVLIVLSFAVCKWAIDQVWQQGFYDSHQWATGVVLIIAAILCGLFVYALKQERLLLWIAKITQSRPLHQPHKTHTFFFIPIRYWPVLLIVFGAGVCIQDLVR